jgi:hypothetical protein
LKSVEDPTHNVQVTLSSRPEWSRPRRQGIFEVLGRSDPVISTEVQGSRRGTVTLRTTSAAAGTTLETLLAEDVQLLQFPAAWGMTEIWLITGDVTERGMSPLYSDLKADWEIPHTEVSRPADAWAPESDAD